MGWPQEHAPTKSSYDCHGPAARLLRSAQKVRQVCMKKPDKAGWGKVMRCTLPLQCAEWYVSHGYMQGEEKITAFVSARKQALVMCGRQQRGLCVLDLSGWVPSDGAARRGAALRHCKSAAVIKGASCSDTNECNIRLLQLARSRVPQSVLTRHLEHRT
jgi:hypothetical protein